ncbi:hypothetical protein LB507_001846 [Fusarium sp. FIESC RH6]|nr:hypothetical protein LB507_001846 [Fusarium sp. FIESC RH6]
MNHLEEYWMQRRQMPRPSRRELPPVPLYPWNDKEAARRSSSASSSTLVCDDEGDVEFKDGKEEQAPTAQLPTPDPSQTPPKVDSLAKEAVKSPELWSEGTDDTAMDLS